MFYLSGNIKGNLIGVVDSDDMIEEFYTKDFLSSTGLEIIRFNKELTTGYRFETDCFEFILTSLKGVLGWNLKAKRGITKFRNKSNYLGYPVISLTHCFKGYSYKRLDVSEMDTSNVITMHEMFFDCRNLISLDLSNFDTSKVNNMVYLFGQCVSLVDLNISSFDTSNVVNMYSMFNHCRSLKSLDLTHFDTSKIDNLTSMFYHCESLEYLNLAGLDTSNVTKMHSMFANCTKLKSLYLSSFDTSNVVNMDFMFRSCESLVDLDLSSFNTTAVINMEGMFCYCSNLRNLVISSFETSRVKTMREMFAFCESLKSLDLSNFRVNKVLSFNYMFKGCSSLEFLNLTSFKAISDNLTLHTFGIFEDCPLLNLLVFGNVKEKIKGVFINDLALFKSFKFDGIVALPSNFDVENARTINSLNEISKLLLMGYEGTVLYKNDNC